VLVVHAGTDATLAAARAAWHAISDTPIRLGELPVEVSASVGVAFAGPGIGHRRLLHHADVAMYQAKTTGGGVHAHIPGTGEASPSTRPVHRHRDRHA
jgi:GGDEF domain-containing protein